MSSLTAQTPAIEPGVSLELAKWRAERYSDVRYKLSLTLEKMSPVLKGTMEIRLRVGETGSGGVKESEPGAVATGFLSPIILDWRRNRGHEEKSTISNVSVNGKSVSLSTNWPPANAGGSDFNEHLIFRDGVVVGENVIKLDFTSPILTSGSAITRYIDKEDGSEYIYSLFVPSDASTVFPVFDQPDLKARFELSVWQRLDLIVEEKEPIKWRVISNEDGKSYTEAYRKAIYDVTRFPETKPISTYVFAFAAGPWERVSSPTVKEGATRSVSNAAPSLTVGLPTPETSIYVRKSQAEKFKPHAAEVFRLNREAIKYFEEYFDYKFPFLKYDLVLIPEFPFGGMEHAGATFLRESSIIFPQEPTKNDHISRALLMLHEASHQWFGDTVTMRWFDDLWLKEGFATFTAYKAMEKIMPEMNAWKVFYERVKQAAYQTDSTKGTTPIYQEIKNLSAAKSAYGNIVYNKAPAFLRQAEFYLDEDKFQTAVRAFLKKHEFGNAGWEDLVEELEAASEEKLQLWANKWIMQRGMPIYRTTVKEDKLGWTYRIDPSDVLNEGGAWSMRTKGYYIDRYYRSDDFSSPYGLFFRSLATSMIPLEDGLRHTHGKPYFRFFFPNSHDYGYGIFLLDPKSRDYVLKNIGREKDDFLRTMMWGALWDSVREGELDPKVFLETAIKNLPSEQDETMAASIASRAGTALNYYVSDKTRVELAIRIENVFSDKMQTAPTLGQRITFYRAFLNVAASENARNVLKGMLAGQEVARKDAKSQSGKAIPLKTKDKFDIVARLLILGDPDAPKLLADLEKTETGDDAKRYAYAAKAGLAAAEYKAKYWNDFVNNKDISESWIEAAFGPWNSIRHSEMTLPYLDRALKELPNHKRNRKIFFVNGWLGAFIGGQRSEAALGIVNKFLADNPNLDRDLRLKILENMDVIERAVKIRKKWNH